MIRTIQPGERCGCVQIPASKSQAHRLLILAALGSADCRIQCQGISRDIAATMDCLNALGASIRVEGQEIFVSPIRKLPDRCCHLYCGESGSTLRFLLPVVGALGARAAFHLEGRLPHRPLAPLDEELRAHGMQIRQEGELLCCEGKLQCGSYRLPGNVSSQYISGLLMALPIVGGESRLCIVGKLESAAYVTMTEDALKLAGIPYSASPGVYEISGDRRAVMPLELQVEGDWSNAAFFLTVGALSEQGMKVTGLNLSSSQGDRAVLDLLRGFGAEIAVAENALLIRKGSLHGQMIDASPIPDLIPVLCVAASVCEGDTRIINAYRLRLKESDRLHTTSRLLLSLGAAVEELEDGLLIHGKKRLKGGSADAFGDHRIAMSAAVAACVCESPVILTGAEAVAKSYPDFWDHFEQLTGVEA